MPTAAIPEKRQLLINGKLCKHNVRGSRFYFRQLNPKTSSDLGGAAEIRGYGQTELPPSFETPLQNPYI